MSYVEKMWTGDECPNEDDFNNFGQGIKEAKDSASAAQLTADTASSKIIRAERITKQIAYKSVGGAL